jgi:phosphoenolpyruvate carboxylase
VTLPLWCLCGQLVRLDIRQSSDRIAGALDGVTRHLGLGSYSQWTEADRQVGIPAALT